MAVGSSADSRHGVHGLAAEWDGTHWFAVSTAVMMGGLLGVDCVSASDCTAVGYGGVVRWNGSTWHAEVTDTSNQRWLYAVACRSATDCTAVGVDLNTADPLVMHRAGNTWSAQPTPQTQQFATLSGVACPSSTSCIATGMYDETGFSGLAERSSGSHWSLIDPPGPDAGGPAGLGAVSCTSTTRCWSVEAFGGGEMELWNGAQWSKASLPGSGYELDGVSCEQSRPCVAVGTQALRFG